MSLFDFLLSLILVFNPGISEADFDNVYSVLDDTAIRSIVVEDSALDKLSQLVDGVVMPLDFTSSDSTNLGYIKADVTRILSALKVGGNGSSVADMLSTISSKIGISTGSTTILNYLSTINSQLKDFISYFGNSYGGGTKVGFPSMIYDTVNAIKNKLASSSVSGGWDVPLTDIFLDVPSGQDVSATVSPFHLLTDFRNNLVRAFYFPAGFDLFRHDGVRETLTQPMLFAEYFSHFVLGLRSYLTASSGWDYWVYNGTQETLDRDMSFIELFANYSLGLRSSLFLPTGFHYLDRTGYENEAGVDIPLVSLFSSAMLGLSANLVGVDRQTAFSFLQEDIFAEAQEVSTNNLLDALGIVGTQLQQPLQKLAYVFANPQDLEIRKDVSDNVDQAQEDFFKPDGAGSVKPSNIKDAAGISGGAAGALSSPGSVGDVMGQINNSDNFSFFSQTTLGNLDTVPVAVSEDEDDFIDFYDPSNPSLWEALGR